MRLSRALLRAAAAVAAAGALAACASAAPPRTSSLIKVAPLAAAAGDGADVAPSTTSAGVTSTTAAASTTAAPATTAAAPPAEPTGAAPPETTAAPAPGPTAAPAPPTTGALVARVAAMYTSIGYPVSEAEAACLATSTSPASLTEIEAKGDAGIIGATASNLVQSLARCEPVSFLNEQDEITIEDYKVDAAQARCVTKALNAAAVADPVVALAYFEGTATLSGEKQQQLVDTLTPCVGAAKAREIVTS